MDKTLDATNSNLAASSSTGMIHRSSARANGRFTTYTAECASDYYVQARAVYLRGAFRYEHGTRPAGRLCSKCFPPVAETTPVETNTDAARVEFVADSVEGAAAMNARAAELANQYPASNVYSLSDPAKTYQIAAVLAGRLHAGYTDPRSSKCIRLVNLETARILHAYPSQLIAVGTL